MYDRRLLTLLYIVYGIVADCWAYCPGVCICKWKSGKQSVECSDKGLITIPEGIDQQTQLLDVSGNNLQVLPRETFVRARLFDLQKVYLRNCSIGQIDDRALRGLSNVVDLDLSRNLLTSVPSSTFEDVPNLRNLSLAYNPIQKIDASAFRHVASLTKLDLSHCRITVIASRAFDGVEFLELLRLNDNKLSELRIETVDALNGLQGIELHENPWYCDCGLRTLKVWLSEKNVPYTVEPRCVGGPQRLANRSFGQLHADDFACKPEMKVKPDNRLVESAAGENATIVCRVDAVPRANISWYWNGRLLFNNSAFGQQQQPAAAAAGPGVATTTPYSYQRIVVQDDTAAAAAVAGESRSSLTLINAQESDSSQFYCVAINRAGVAEANFTLRIVHRFAAFAVLGNGRTTVVSFALIALICSILALIVYLLCRIRKMPASVGDIKHNQHRHSIGGEEQIIVANGTVYSPHADGGHQRKSMSPSAIAPEPSYTGTTGYQQRSELSQTLPRGGGGGGNGGISYTIAFDDQTLPQTYRPERSNPDLIADARYQESLEAAQKSGQYARAIEPLYPSSLWSRSNEQIIRKLYRTTADGGGGGGGGGGQNNFYDVNDKTPIIEQVSFGVGERERRESSISSSSPSPSSTPPINNGGGVAVTTTTTAAATTQHQPHQYQHQYRGAGTDCGESSIGDNQTHPNAKTIRVWQKGVQVLPPVTALKRALNRNSPDEGYQEGCGTDV